MRGVDYNRTDSHLVLCLVGVVNSVTVQKTRIK